GVSSFRVEEVEPGRVDGELDLAAFADPRPRADARDEPRPAGAVPVLARQRELGIGTGVSGDGAGDDAGRVGPEVDEHLGAERLRQVASRTHAAVARRV